MRPKLLLLVFIVNYFSFSCSKDTKEKIPETTYGVQGLWIGSYTVDNIPAQGQLFYSLSVFPDGTIATKSKASDGKFYYSEGTWTLTASNQFAATIKNITTPLSGSPVTQAISATFLNSGKLTDGTWTDVNNPNGAGLKGKFPTMERVN